MYSICREIKLNDVKLCDKNIYKMIRMKAGSFICCCSSKLAGIFLLFFNLGPGANDLKKINV